MSIYYVLVLCAAFYIVVLSFGFRNVYAVLWKQRKYKFVPLSLLYLCAQSVCVLRIVQYVMLFYTIYTVHQGLYCQMDVI